MATALSSAAKENPRENWPLGGAAAVTIMEENIDLIFSLRRSAPPSLRRRGPGHGKHLFTQSGISGKTRTHKKHTRKLKFTEFKLFRPVLSNQHLAPTRAAPS